MNLNRFLMVALVGVAMVTGTTGLYAQQQHGELVVRVTDQSGGVLPGASVILTSPALIRPVDGVTDSKGVFRYPVLPPGIYSVTVATAGFATVVQDNVEVDVGRTFTIPIRLDVAAVQETITVSSASPVVDVVSSESVGVFKGEQLEKTPGPRDYTQFSEYMPSVNIDAMSGTDTTPGAAKCTDCAQAGTGGQQTGPVGISVDGSSGAENVFYVDGIDTTSMYTGMPNQGIRTEFVQEFQVKTAGYEAQYGGAMGGVMSVVTRSGSNAFHGAGFLYHNSSALNAGPRQRLRLDPDSAVDVAQYTQDPEDDFKRNEFGFTLGGPIVEDNAWFFVGVSPMFSTRERTVDFVSGTSGNFKRDDSLLNFIGKVDYQPHPNVRLSGSYAQDTTDQTGGLPIYDGTDNPDFDWDQQGWKFPSRTYMVSGQVIPNPDFMIDARFGSNHLGKTQALEPPGVRHFFIQSNGLIGFPTTDPLYRPRFFAEYGFSDGFFTELDDQNKNTFSVALNNYFDGGGSHNLTYGYQFNRLGQNVNDAYRFDYIREYFGQIWTTVDGSQPTSACTGPDGNRYDPCGYYEVRTPFGVVADVHTNRQAFYAQDAWTIGSRVTLNLGMRFEKEAIPSFSDLPEFQGAAFEWGFGDKAAPRLGASWDVRGDGKIKAFGSWGWFYDAMKLEMANGSFGGFKWISTYYLFDDTNLDWSQAGGVSGQGNYPGQQIDQRNWRIPSFEDLDPNLDAMRMTEAVAGLEYEVRPDTALSFRYVHKSVDRAIEDVGRQTPAGEAYYITNPGRGLSVSKFVEAGLPPTPDAQRTYNAFEVRLRKRYRHHWGADISYTYSRLRGLYSGLGSSDENGRLSPNVDRDFDLWFLNYDSNGNFVGGPLNTDRPHQFKAFLNYRFDFGLNVGGFFRGMSGTPITRTADMENVDVIVENRGSDGRNPTWTQTDLFLIQEIPLGLEGGRRLEVSFNIVNLFNQDTALRSFRSYNRDTVGLWVPGDPTSTILNGYDYKAIIAAEGVDVDPRFLKPDRFQVPFTARFGLKFVF